MRSPALSRRPPGWFAHRSLAVKFGLLVGVVIPAFAALLGTLLVSNAAVNRARQDAADLNNAQALVLQLDTRASEFKVDAFRALVRPDPQAELPNLDDDVATADDLLAQLA